MSDIKDAGGHGAIMPDTVWMPAFMEFVPALIVVKDHESRIVFANRKTWQLFPVDDWMGKNPHELFLPAIADQITEKDRETLVTGFTTYEETWEDKEGHQHTFLTENFRIDIPGGTPLLGSVITDITNQGYAEEKLQIEERYKALIEHAPDGIVMVSREGKFTYASPPASRMFGYDQAELVLCPPESLTHPDDLPMVFDTLSNLMANAALVPTIQYRFRHKNGNWYWIESTFSNLLEIPGIQAIVINFRDISDRKDAEDKLRESESRARESDRLKSAFLANMSHEIRTPMNAIVGFAEMLSDPGLTADERSKFTAIIQSRSDDLMHIINDLLEISRIESGNVIVSKTRVVGNEILEELETVFRERVKRSKNPGLSLKLEKSLPDAGSAIFTDVYILKQVFSNLLENAIKYTHSGLITFGYLPPGNGIITFYVKDTGIGISAENQLIIFENFRQAEIENPHQYSGTGLGLAICKGSLAQVGGTIWVESALGKGSVFYFTLPFDLRETAAIWPPVPVRPAMQPPLPGSQFCWAGKKLLIVEDEPANMEFLMIILKRTFIGITPVESGASLRKLYHDLDQFNLVLLDVRLPDANGWELAGEIKKIRPELPVIAQTAYAMSADLQKSLAAGCDNYISKPIGKNQLLNMMAEYLGE